MTPPETEPKPPAGVGGPPAEAWVSRGSEKGRGHWKVPLGVNPHGVHHKPYHIALTPRNKLPQAKKLQGWECNPTHQQIIGLNLY